MEVPAGRKLPPNLENPIDDVMLTLISVIHPLFYKLGFSANGITLLSGIIQLAAVYCLWKGVYITSAILYVIGYFFDVMDGWYARYYHITSDIGDMLDHGKDLIVHILFIAVIIVAQFPLWWQLAFVGTFIGMMIINSVYISCQEAYYNKRYEGASFMMLSSLCTQEDAVDRLRMYRWFGPGTCVTVSALFIALLEAVVQK